MVTPKKMAHLSLNDVARGIFIVLNVSAKKQNLEFCRSCGPCAIE
jgi:hypothetical protein